MRAVTAHLMSAAAGMTLWAWAVLTAQAHFIHLAFLAVIPALAFAAGPFLKHHLRRRRRKL